MRLILTACLVLLACSCVHAQQPPKELPDAPQAKPEAPVKTTHKLNRPVFWLGTAALAGSKSADMWTTRIALDKGRLEGNPVFGPHPSNARLAGISAAFFAADATLFYLTERSQHRWIRWGGRAYIGLVVANHVKLAACSAGSDLHSPPCRPLAPVF